ncbi:hypothetical protein BCON_0337g00070 [Botryotinia convoluta]|uniref:Uncharacterized protein n=1 Tax=Botryotinia convoluta TaxID=54673 RepID=A0A4Z1HAN6_9HELO|nr:hypothetical protein BCON_0337g00070 [Botryotinia convoluta]
MSSRKRKETDKKLIDPNSSTHTRRPCSTKGSDGKRCPRDGRYDDSKGKICRACYDRTHRRATVGAVASSSKTQDRSSQISTPSVSPHSSTDQKHSHRRTETETQSHNVGAPSNKGKRRASRTPPSGGPSPKCYPVSPDLTGIGTSEGLDSSPSLQIPAYGQGNYSVEYEPYKPPQHPQPSYRPFSPDVTGTYSPGFQTSGYGQQEDPAESESYRPPQSPYRPQSPNFRGFKIPETELTSRAYATRVVEQPVTRSLDGQQIQYPNREYDEGDLYCADTPPEEIWQTSSLTSAPRRRPPVEDFRDPASQRRIRPWESGHSSKQHGGIRSHHSTPTAGGEGSSGFNRMSNVSEIQSQMRSTSIEDPNVLATSNVRGSYDQRPSASHAPSSLGAGPSSSRLPEASQGVLRDERGEYEKQQWELNKHEMQQQHLERYPASNPVSEDPAELRAHRLFAMSLGEGERCTNRDYWSHRCKKRAVAGKRYFYCGEETHNDHKNRLWYRGMLIQALTKNSCYQVMESTPGARDRAKRQCRRTTKEIYCDLENHCEKNFNVPQPRIPLRRNHG